MQGKPEQSEINHITAEIEIYTTSEMQWKKWKKNKKKHNIQIANIGNHFKSTFCSLLRKQAGRAPTISAGKLL